ncbi:MAG: hypothetical protein ABIQ15_05295 [Nocardioides sp.]
MRKGAVRTSRLRWFTGRFITAHDLTAEQEYFLDRHRLHNRLLHGWGAVCGLEVHPHDRADCAHEWVWVDAGIAIDCLGREIVLPCREAVQWQVDPQRTSDEDALAVLCLRYDECLTDPLPAIVGGCEQGTATELSRVVERWRLEVHPLSDDPQDPWTALVRGDRVGCGHDGGCAGDCGCSTPGDGGCLQPACPLGDCVPIALLSRCRGEAIAVDAERDGLRPAVRRSLPPPAAYLTHVVGTSWEHGMDLAVDDLDARGGELRVHFDRDLADGEQDRVGINQHTFLVEIEDSTGARERLPFDPDHPPRVEDGCVAVFTVHPDVLHGSGRRGGTRSLVGDTVFVTLLGDLVHDCHGLPVDADFFGSFPSGDGVLGGVLRSWFFVTDRKEAGA